jgi:anti-sigma regulatory factor (Ser/Thr protein kinase)
MCQSATVSYRSDAGVPKLARDYCAEFVAAATPGGQSSIELVDDTRLVVSELVTNALNAGSADVRVTVEVHRGHVRVAIGDDAPSRPQPRDAGPEDGHGRGLTIVAKLSSDWGVEYAEHGKQVWAELRAAAPFRFSVPCHLGAGA